jgi:hypothetical protein
MSGPSRARANQIVSGRAELYVTNLGFAAYEGDERAVLDAIERGIDWTEEDYDPLVGALHGGHRQLARRLLAVMPRSDELYRIVFAHDEDLLAELPPHPELITAMRDDRRQREFTSAVLAGDLAAAVCLLAPSVRSRIDERILLSHGIGDAAPIHYAARRADVALLRLVVEAGADPNAKLDGVSPLRLVAQCPGATRRQRREAYRYLRSVGARMVPEIRSLTLRLSAALGLWLAPDVRG